MKRDSNGVFFGVFLKFLRVPAEVKCFYVLVFLSRDSISEVTKNTLERAFRSEPCNEPDICTSACMGFRV